MTKSKFRDDVSSLWASFNRGIQNLWTFYVSLEPRATVHRENSPLKRVDVDKEIHRLVIIQTMSYQRSISINHLHDIDKIQLVKRRISKSEIETLKHLVLCQKL